MDLVIALTLLAGLYLLGRQDGREIERQKNESTGQTDLPIRFTWTCPDCGSSSTVSASEVAAISSVERLIEQMHAVRCVRERA